MSEVKAVEFHAELRQIKTMVDHTANITLNVPEDCREQVKVLFDWLQDEVTIVIVNGDEPENRKKAGYGKKRKGSISEG